MESIDIRGMTDAEIDQALKPTRPNKWLNKKVEYEGEVFDSQWELEHYLELKAREQAGQIRNLERQVSILLQESFTYRGKTIRAIRLILDFKYQEKSGHFWFTVYDDAKGVVTPEYAVKWKMLQYMYRDMLGVILRLTFK